MKLSLFSLLGIFLFTGWAFGQSPNPNDPNDYQYIFIDAGQNHTAALRCNGTVYTWGDNAFGQLGDANEPFDSDIPVVVSGPGGVDSLTGIIEIACGGNHTLALRADGTVWAWGSNNNGQLGDNLVSGAFSSSPVQVVGINNAVAIDAGNVHSLAILNDGTVVSWGSNNNGRLGDGSTTQRNTPVPMTGADTTIVAIAGGDCHTLALLSNGRVKSCGCDNDGQLGDDKNSGAGDVTALVPVLDVDLNPITNIIGIAAGGSHSLAVKDNGQLYSWGAGGDDDVLGRNTTVPNGKVAGTVSVVNTGVAVAAGYEFSLVMLEDSTLMSWGMNTSGQLGLGDLVLRGTPTAITLLNEKVRAMGAGEMGSHSVCLIVDDSIKTWGENSSGQLGNDNAPTDKNSPVLVQEWELGMIYAVAGPDQAYCDGDSVQIGGEAGDYDLFTYSWFPTTGLSGGGISTNRPDTLAQPFSVISTGTSVTINYILVKDLRGGANQVCIEPDTCKISVSAQATANFSSSAPACVGENVSFVNTGSAGPGSTYAWTFGSGAVYSPGMDTVPNPTGIVYNTDGLKLVTFTVTDVCGGVTTIDVYNEGITIYDQPTASFNFSPSFSICTGTSIDFTNTGSTGSGWSYTWDFGAGAYPSISNAENPSGIVYSTAGTKTVTLTISNGNCTETYSNTLVVNQTPVADFASTAPECTGLDVDFTNTGSTGGGWTYSWNFGTGASPGTSALESPAGVTYATAGTKLVKLVTTNGTCSDSVTYIHNIYQSPTVSFTSTEPECAGTGVDFTNTGSTGGGWSYFWDFGENSIPATSTTENPSGILYGTNGTKTVTLTISNGNCTETYTDNVTINEKPVANFASTAPECTGLNVDFTNTGSTGGGWSYSWDFGAGANPATSAVENPAAVVYSTSGIKLVKLIVTNGTCVDSITQTINIYQAPTVSFTSTEPECAGSSVDFTNTGSTGGSWSYFWDFGPGAIPATSTTENPAGVLYGSYGVKTVALTISNGNCTGMFTDNVTINQKPIANFASTAPECTGLDVDFTNTGSTGGGWTYSWDFGTGSTPATSVAENPTGVVYSTAGVKLVKLVITNGTCSDSITQNINVYLTPTTTFVSTAPQCVNTDVDFTNTGSTGGNWSYEWDFGDGADPATSNAESPTGVSYITSGTKTVTFKIFSPNCSQIAVQNITINATPAVSFTSTAPKCTGATVDFVSTGTTSDVIYEWNFGSGATPDTSVVKDPAGIIYSTAGIKNISLTSTDTVTGCYVTQNGTILINLTPTVSFTTNAPQCVNEGVNFLNSGTTGPLWSYNWDFGDDAVPVTSSSENPAGIQYVTGGTKTITLTIFDAFCTSTAAQNIDVYSLPVADAGTDTTICANRSVQIGNADIAGYSYSWFPSMTLDDPYISDPVASPVANSTMYIVTVNDDTTACVNYDTVIVTMLPPLVADAGIDVEICNYDSIQIGAGFIEGQYYTWDPSDGLSDPARSNPIAKPNISTIYTLSVTDTLGCDAITDNVTVTVHPLPDANAGEDDTITFGSSIQLIATGGVQYFWEPSESLDNAGIYNPVATPEITTSYVVFVTDIHGCENNDTVLITVIESSLWIPTAFTPNGDGRNDILYVRGEGIEDFEFKIFDRWGETVFYSQDMTYGWDGTRQTTGEKMPEGAYVYFVKGTKTDGEKVNFNGMVNLIR